jgi:hypothetical protein
MMSHFWLRLQNKKNKMSRKRSFPEVKEGFLILEIYKLIRRNLVLDENALLFAREFDSFFRLTTTRCHRVERMVQDLANSGDSFYLSF